MRRDEQLSAADFKRHFRVVAFGGGGVMDFLDENICPPQDLGGVGQLGGSSPARNDGSEFI